MIIASDHPPFSISTVPLKPEVPFDPIFALKISNLTLLL